MATLNMHYDIIGDIHGHDKTLILLLEELGFINIDGTYCHPERKAIFLGDFIDRGPGQREVITIAHRMVTSGSALAVMGNHEFNAIAYATYNKSQGDYLREHSAKNHGQHKAFLDAYADTPNEYADVISWFKTLPLWLDLGDLRVVHACWDHKCIERITDSQNGSNQLLPELMAKSSLPGTWQFNAIETLLKGKEIPLKEGYSFHDKDGHERHHIRVKWWDQRARSYKSAFIGPESVRTHIPDDEIHGDHLIEYSQDEPPVFLGHYWLEGTPSPLSSNICCVDYSVAKTGGKLVAYRWDGESTLCKDKFISVEQI